MTDTRIDLNARFRLAPDAELTDWLARIIAAARDGEQVEGVGWETPYITEHWDPRQVDEETAVDLLVQAAVGDGIIACPDGMTVNFVYDGSSYWFTVDIGNRVIDQVQVNTWGYEMRKLVGDGVVGADAAASILAEAVSAANSALDRLQRLIAASIGTAQ